MFYINLMIVGIVFMVTSYYFLVIKAGKFSLKKSFIGKLAFKLSPKKESKEFKKIDKKLKNAFLKIDVESFMAIKISILVATFVFLILIFITNTYMGREKIFSSVVYSHNKNSISNNVTVRKNAYNLVKSSLNVYSIEEKNKNIQNAIKEIIIKKDLCNINEAEELSLACLYDILSINKLYTSKRIIIYLSWIPISYFLLDLIIYILTEIRRNKFNNEIKNLTNLITVICSSNNSITVNKLISIVINNAKLSKEKLQSFYMLYMMNKEEAYKIYLHSNINSDKNFERLISIFKQIEESDKDIAIRNIINYNKNLNKVKEIEYKTKLEKKEGIALVLFSVSVLWLVKLIMGFLTNGINNIQNMGL